MAHVEKYHIGAIGHLCRHFERAKDNDGNYIKFRNQSIDLSRTASNYNLATFQPLPQKEFIRKRLSEVKVLKRADVKVMCDWVVTLPKRMELEERKFFGETFNFLTNRYGKENVISAYVHRDETQPHLHFAFVPATMDKKKNIPKVSAKEVLTRVELQRFHGDLDAYLESVFDKSTGVLNGTTRDGNKSIDELKRGTAVKELNALLQERQAEEKRIEGLKWSDRIVPVKEKGSTVVISKVDFESANDALVKK
ncbi:MAG: plasmid recombination protein, partial [Firmicutes bacterium]|nr:plasmid recombination protein [Bacillota bacterium]